jgi:peptidoglycan/LPS O-acetylase OafA/YrhL
MAETHAPDDQTRLGLFKEALYKLSWINAFKDMKATRCNPWDDQELDLIEGFRLIGLIMLQFTATTLFLNNVPQYNFWKMVDLLPQLMFTVIIACSMICDFFFYISGFLGIYKCMQIYEANGGKLYTSDVFKFYARKFFRLAPMLYLIFFFGWALGSRLREAPVWINYQYMFYECDKYWWA